MSTEDLDLEVVDQFLADVGSAAPELVDLFIDETNSRLARMGKMATDQNWSSLAIESHALKSAASTYGLGGIADIADQLDHACRKNDDESAVRYMAIIQNAREPALTALHKAINE